MSEDVNGGKSHYIPQWYAQDSLTIAVLGLEFTSVKCSLPTQGQHKRGM